MKLKAERGFYVDFKTLMVNDRGIGTHTINNPNHLSAIGPENKRILLRWLIHGYRRFIKNRGLTANCRCGIELANSF